jgi:hypothetical protein
MGNYCFLGNFFFLMGIFKHFCSSPPLTRILHGVDKATMANRET